MEKRTDITLSTQKKIACIIALATTTITLLLGYMAFFMYKAFMRYEYEMLNESEKLLNNTRTVWGVAILLGFFLILDYLFSILWLKDRKHARSGFFILTLIHLLAAALCLAQYLYSSYGHYATVLTPVLILIMVWTAGVDAFLFWVMKRERQKIYSQ